MGKRGLPEMLGLGRVPLLSPDEFRLRITGEILKRRPDAEPGVLGETELIRANGDRISTSPGYALYKAHPRALDSLVEQTVDWFLAEPTPVSVEALLAVVRPSELSAAEYQAEGHGLARPIAGA